MGLLLICLCFSFILVSEYKPSMFAVWLLEDIAQICMCTKYFCLEKLHGCNPSCCVMSCCVMLNCITPLIHPILKMLVFSDWIISLTFQIPSYLWHPSLGNSMSQVSGCLSLFKVASFGLSLLNFFPLHFYSWDEFCQEHGNFIFCNCYHCWNLTGA